MLEARVGEYDLVIVGDFGHHLLEPEAIEILCRKANCLAVNTQSNAANHGFNTASKYSPGRLYCISEKEIRLEARQRRRTSREIIAEGGDEAEQPEKLIVRGRAGLVLLRQG